MRLHLIKTSDNKLYQVIDQVPETKSINVEDHKQKHDCTNVFRKENMLWFVQLIEDAKIVEEITEEVIEIPEEIIETPPEISEEKLGEPEEE